MQLLAGTSRGIFAVGDSTEDAAQVFVGRGVRDIVTVGERIFAGTAEGLYLSDDNGQSWELAGLEDREVWQVRSAGGDVVYATTQPSGLFRSDDHGSSWFEIESFADLPEASHWRIPLDPPLAARARALVIDQHDPDRLWVGVEVGGIASTTDGGATWDVIMPGDNPDLHMLFPHPERPGMLFASTGYGRFDHIAEEIEGNAGVLRSNDYGATWEYAWEGITPRYSRPMCIDDRAPVALTVASAPNAFSSHKDQSGAEAMLFRSYDEGASWESLGDEAHSPSAANFHGLTVDPSQPGGVLVGTDTGELWQVSLDGEWTELASGLPTVLSIAPVPS